MSCWSELTRKVHGLQPSHHRSAEQEAVKGIGTLVSGMTASEPAKASFACRWGRNLASCGFCSPAHISREAHFQVRLSFVQFLSPTRLFL